MVKFLSVSLSVLGDLLAMDRGWAHSPCTGLGPTFHLEKTVAWNCIPPQSSLACFLHFSIKFMPNGRLAFIIWHAQRSWPRTLLAGAWGTCKVELPCVNQPCGASPLACVLSLPANQPTTARQKSLIRVDAVSGT